MRKTHWRKCFDVRVMRGADCNTDHRMLRAKLVVGRMRAFKMSFEEAVVKRWDLARLQGRTMDERGWKTTRGRYLRSAGEKLRED